MWLVPYTTSFLVSSNVLHTLFLLYRSDLSHTNKRQNGTYLLFQCMYWLEKNGTHDKARQDLCLSHDICNKYT
jgi:hypothetical protein